MKKNIPQTITCNSKEYKIISLLGKGKGGYSYLGEYEGKLYTVKKIHHEPCSYYTFGNKIEAEYRDYHRIKETGIDIPKMIDIDFKREVVVKEYIKGKDCLSLAQKGKLKAEYVLKAYEIEMLCKIKNINIDYYPANFIYDNGTLYYVDYECNEYDPKYDFINWGRSFWYNARNELNILHGNSKNAFALWMKKNSLIEKECFVEVNKGKPIDKDKLYYIDAIYIALRYGWIDSAQKVIDGVRYIRFSPRKKSSNWTELNKERARKLLKQNKMNIEGRLALPDLNIDLYNKDEDAIKIMKEEGIYEVFTSFPYLYQKIRLANLYYYKSYNDELYQKALNNFLKHTRNKEMYGEWNDYGRLR